MHKKGTKNYWNRNVCNLGVGSGSNGVGKPNSELLTPTKIEVEVGLWAQLRSGADSNSDQNFRSRSWSNREREREDSIGRCCWTVAVSLWYNRRCWSHCDDMELGISQKYKKKMGRDTMLKKSSNIDEWWYGVFSHVGVVEEGSLFFFFSLFYM